MDEKEREYLLTIAIIFLKEFDFNKNKGIYLEFAYFIILKYSLIYKDFLPLYDFSVNFGFYPIVSTIVENNLIEFNSLINFNLKNGIQENFKNNNNIIETLEQNKMRKFLFNNKINKNISIIAPTSFGKSNLIIENIKENLKLYKKIAIIVPTKSLLAQIYKDIKIQNLDRKIIIHDTMYQKENEFISILTQERALRLLDQNLFFDCLYIDEAHKIFNKDPRAIFLSRLIKINGSKNKNQKVIYFSPLISNSKNLKLNKNEEINENRISFNIKEPEYYEYRLDEKVYKYNRFLNKFYEINSSYNDFFDYIFSTKKNRNFIFLNSPKKIQLFAKTLYSKIISEINDIEIKKTIKILTKYVDKYFFGNDYLQKGIIYLHGQLPDNIKEYLEYKFLKLKNIVYLIANNVILEGVNLPIENIYILNTRGLYQKDLTNLIGRANRLKEIFNGKNNLDKLLPQIHFINTEIYNNKNSKMQSKIKFFTKIWLMILLKILYYINLMCLM